MNTQDNQDLKIFDHPPTLEELLQQQAEAEKNDPRSTFYKRALVRPKVSVGKLLLWILAGVVLGLACYIPVRAWTDSALCGWLAGLVAVGILCLIFSKRLVIAAVRLYQAWAPLRLRKRCRYEPSCSEYMILAIEKYGTRTGFRKGVARWAGCKPPNGGYDMP